MTDIQAEKVENKPVSWRLVNQHGDTVGWYSHKEHAEQDKGRYWPHTEVQALYPASLLTKLQADLDEAFEALDRAANGEAEYTRKWTLAEARAEALQAEVDRLKSRLEIVQDGWPDGIATRDETIRQQDALISELKAENERVQSIIDSTSLGTAMDTEYRLRIAAEGQLTTLRARISELEKALEPFVAYFEVISAFGLTFPKDGTAMRSVTSAGEAEITMEQFRSARATLKGGEK